MNTDELKRVVGTIEPDSGLKVKILDSCRSRSRFYMDSPLRIIAAFGMAGVLCACAIGLVFVFGNANKPRTDILHPSIPAQTTNAMIIPSNTDVTPETPQATPSPTFMPTPTAEPLVVNHTLPDGIILPQEALSIFRTACLEYFNVDTGDCLAFDFFSYNKGVLLGTKEIYLSEKYDWTKGITVYFSDYTKDDHMDPHEKRPNQYPIQFSLIYNDYNGTLVEAILDATTGQVVGARLNGKGAAIVGYPEEELKKRKALAKQYVLEKLAGSATVVKTENMEYDSDVSIYLSDGRMIIISIDTKMQITRFYINKDGTDCVVFL